MSAQSTEIYQRGLQVLEGNESFEAGKRPFAKFYQLFPTGWTLFSLSRLRELRQTVQSAKLRQLRPCRTLRGIQQTSVELCRGGQ